MEKFDSFLEYQTWSYHRAQKFCSWLYTQEKHMHLSVQTHTHIQQPNIYCSRHKRVKHPQYPSLRVNIIVSLVNRIIQS